MVEQWQAILGQKIKNTSELEREIGYERERKIGMNDNFYDLGGHSILAMALAAVLECDVRSIAAHPTPASLLVHLQLQASEAETTGSSKYMNLLSSLEEVSDLTRTEKRMVFIQLQNPGHTTYNMPFCVKFNENVDLLKNAQTVVDALPILRTRFVNGKAVEDVEVIVEDLTAARQGNEYILQYIFDSPFDMSVGPLCRFGVDVESNTLYGSIHHSIGDGRSIQILLDAINVGTVKASTSEWSIRKYAAFEALPEVVIDQRALVEKYVELLGDTPPRLEVDFVSPPEKLLD